MQRILDFLYSLQGYFIYALIPILILAAIALRHRLGAVWKVVRSQTAAKVCLLLYPLALVHFSMFYFQLEVTPRYLVDVIALCALFCAVAVPILAIKQAVVRALLFALLCLPLMIFHWSNMMFYRFFNEPLPFDALTQVRAVPNVHGSIATLFMWSDIVRCIVIPAVFAAMALRYRPAQAKRPALACFAIGAIALALQFGLSFTAMPGQFDPFVAFFRDSFGQRRLATDEQIVELAGRRAEFFPYEAEHYDLAPLEQGYLLKIPKGVPAKPARMPNVVLILLESVRAFESGAYGAPVSYTPKIDKLAKDGAIFENIYANGSQTVRGDFATAASQYPSLGGSVDFTSGANIHVSTLAGVLKDCGYRTNWICAYDKNFQGFFAFHSTHGIDHFHSGEEMPKEPHIGFGLADHAMFDYAIDVLNKEREPFFAQLLTESNHYPFYVYPTNNETPPADGSPEYVRFTQGTFYTDWAVGRFFDAARKEPWFKNTIFVIAADHGIYLFPRTPKLSPAQQQEAAFRIPLVMYGPEWIKPVRSRAVGGQVDIAPTVLDVIGLRVKNTFVGRSLLNTSIPESERFAFLLPHNRWMLRKGNRYYYGTNPLTETRDVRVDDVYGRYRWTYADNQEIGFSFDGDLLRTHPSDAMLLPPNEVKREIEWARTTMQLSNYLLRYDKVLGRKTEDGE